MAFAHDQDSLVGAVLGGYRIERSIGEGGMGTVYLAHPLAAGRAVAIKVLHAEHGDDPVRCRRFVREARVAAQVVHPNVARVLDVGRTPERVAYFVMEHLEGEDLSQRLEREGALPWAQARRIAIEAARGLQAAHDIGVIHRDIKPSNLFLVAAGGGRPPVVKVVDFGIAKSTDPSSSFAYDLTLADKIIGTPEYMPPERIMGEAADPRSDVYSLGVVMFEMLTGRLPWGERKDGMGALIRRMRNPSPTLPPGLPGIPAEAVALVTRAMMRDPRERFASLRELVAALEQVPALEPVSVTEVGDGGRGGVRRAVAQRTPRSGMGYGRTPTERVGCSRAVLDSRPA